MPVDRSRYGSNWPKVSLTIRRIAGNRCEWCGVPNGVPLPSGQAGKVILTVAHLGAPYADGRPGDKHDKHDIRRENLAALCQRCHLMYDLPDHMAHARETRARKKREEAAHVGQMNLLPE
jgi:5-methylcytosine-specific restriction endonuclease McrA